MHKFRNMFYLWKTNSEKRSIIFHDISTVSTQIDQVTQASQQYGTRWGTAVHLEWSPPPQMQSGQIQGYTIEFREAGQSLHPSCCRAIDCLTETLQKTKCLPCFFGGGLGGGGLVGCFLFVVFSGVGVCGGGGGWGGGGEWGGGRVFFSECKTKADYIKNIKKSSETSLTASFLKQDPNTWKLQHNAIY